MSKSASRYNQYRAVKQAGIYSLQKNNSGFNRDFIVGKIGDKLSNKAQNKCVEYFSKLILDCKKVNRYNLNRLKQADLLLSKIHNTGINAKNRVKLKKLHAEIRDLLARI